MTNSKRVIIAAAAVAIAVTLVVGAFVAMAVLGVFRLEKQPLTIQSASFETTYTGEQILLSGDTCELISGNLAEGDTLAVTMTANVKYIGTYENTFTVKITDKKGNDVTAAYEPTLVFGEVHVVPRPITFYSGSDEKEYDGTPLTCIKAGLSDGTLCAGHSWQATVSGAQTDCGTSKNTVSVAITDAAGKDVSENYDVTYEAGTLTVTPITLTFVSESATKDYDGTPLRCDVVHMTAGHLCGGHFFTSTVTGEQTEVGSSANFFSVVIKDDATGKDVTKNYDLKYEPGTLTVYPRVLTFTSDSAEKEYDGTPLTCDKVRLTAGQLREGHAFSANVTGKQTEAGSSLNKFTVVITDTRTGKDVTKEYNVTYDPGTLTVYPRALTFTSDSAEKEYDSTPLTCDVVNMTSGKLCAGHTYQVIVTGEQTKVGSSRNHFGVIITDEKTGKDVSQNYDVTCECGALTVTPIYVTFQSGSAQKVYDGTPLTNDEVTIVYGRLLDGHKVAADVTGSQTEIGTSDNTFFVTIVNANGKDVSDCYRISTANGTLAVLEPSGGGGDVGDDGEGGSGSGNEGQGSGGGGGINPFSYYVLSNRTGVLYLREMNYGNEYNGYNFDDPDAWYGETTSPMVYAGNAMKNVGADVGYCTVWMPKAQASIVYRIMPYYLVDGNEEETSDVLHMVSRDTSYSYNYVPYTYRGGSVRGRLTDTMSAEEKEYRDWVYRYYLDVPESTAEVFRQLAAENGLSADSPTIVNDVVEYIRHAAKYNLDYEVEPKNVDRAVYFLTESKEGICQHYAVAATLMFRLLGIPARYVHGFLVPVTAGVKTEVTGNMGHAWTEIYVDGIGWMQVDATGSSEDGGGHEHDTDTDTDEDVEADEELTEYIMNLLRGKLEVAIVTNEAVKTYDGEPFTDLTCSYAGELLEGDYIEEIVMDDTKDAGVHPNRTHAVIKDADGNDVTDKYTGITWECGKLTIMPAPLTIQSGSVSQSYDGTPVSCTEYTILAGEVMAGEEIIVTGCTERTEKGSENNILTIKIMREGIDVTDNYSIQQVYGTVTVSQ